MSPRPKFLPQGDDFPEPHMEYPRPARIGKHDGLILRLLVCAPLAIVGGFVWICVYA